MADGGLQRSKLDESPGSRGVIRVLFVAHDSGLFGAQRTLLTLLQGINRERFDCRVVVPWSGEFAEEVERLGIPIERRQMVRWVPEAAKLVEEGRFRYLRRLGGNLRERCWAIARIIKRHHIDVVYTNTAVCVEGAIAARMAGVRHVWHIHESLVENAELAPVFWPVFHAAAIRMLSFRVIFCSKSVSFGYPLLVSRAAIVYNGLPLPPRFDRLVARAKLRRHLRLESDADFISIVGALQPRKDHKTFLAAAQLVAEKCKDAHFVIAGSGPPRFTDLMRRTAEELGIRDRTHFLGWWPPGSIHELLAASEVAVVSSRQEPFGLTVIEALSVETPVVATRCGGPEEILRDQIDGILVPVGGVDEMATAIVEVLRNRAKGRAFGRAGRQRVATLFSTEKYVRSLECVIEEAAERVTVTNG